MHEASRRLSRLSLRNPPRLPLRRRPFCEPLVSVMANELFGCWWALQDLNLRPPLHQRRSTPFRASPRKAANVCSRLPARRNGGQDSLKRLIGLYGSLPETSRCRTGSGGLHVYFAYPPEWFVPSRNSLRPGIDLRGEGGYVVAPPSLHKSGQRYTWIVPLGTANLAPTPEWLQATLLAPASAQA